MMMMTFMICNRVKMRLDDLPSDHEKDIGVKDAMVTGLRNSRGLIVLMAHGLYIPKEDDYGLWK